MINYLKDYEIDKLRFWNDDRQFIMFKINDFKHEVILYGPLNNGKYNFDKWNKYGDIVVDDVVFFKYNLQAVCYPQDRIIEIKYYNKNYDELFSNSIDIDLNGQPHAYMRYGAIPIRRQKIGKEVADYNFNDYSDYENDQEQFDENFTNCIIYI